MGINVLAGLLDEKLIKIISLFLKFPDKKFYMSEVARQSGVNSATTFRILQKLVKEELISSRVVGKIRTYQLSNGERARAVSSLLKKDEPKTPLEIFCDSIKRFPHIKMILLDEQKSNSAKILIISDYPSKERLDRTSKELFDKHHFKISFVELRPSQYEGLKSTLGDKRILHKSQSSSM